MKKCRYCGSNIDNTSKVCGNCGKKIIRKKDLFIVIISVLCFALLFFGQEKILNFMIKSSNFIESIIKERTAYSNPELESDIVSYLNKKYSDEFEIVKFVKKTKLHTVSGNGIGFYDTSIDGSRYIEYVAKSKTNNIEFNVAYVLRNKYDSPKYYDFYLINYFEKLFNKKIKDNNTKFNSNLKLRAEFDPSYIDDLDNSYYFDYFDTSDLTSYNEISKYVRAELKLNYNE